MWVEKSIEKNISSRMRRDRLDECASFQYWRMTEFSIYGSSQKQLISHCHIQTFEINNAEHILHIK